MQSNDQSQTFAQGFTSRLKEKDKHTFTHFICQIFSLTWKTLRGCWLDTQHRLQHSNGRVGTGIQQQMINTELA